MQILKRGFGPGRVKDYFVVSLDGDTIAGIVAGPFWMGGQADEAAKALRDLYQVPLGVVAGHVEEVFGPSGF